MMKKIMSQLEIERRCILRQQVHMNIAEGKKPYTDIDRKKLDNLEKIFEKQETKIKKKSDKFEAEMRELMS